MLQGRLLEAAKLVRPGSRVVDVGTDHAYLPIALVREGKVRSAIAADLRPGPLERAKKNIAEARLTDKIRTVLSNGLTAISQECYDDVVICGMGGETIISILEAAKIWDSEKWLVLQPQTAADRLREYLYQNGYQILCERFVEDGKKLYNLLCAQYRGERYPMNPIDLLISPAAVRERPPLFELYLANLQQKLRKRGAGLVRSEQDKSEELKKIDALLAALERIAVT